MAVGLVVDWAGVGDINGPTASTHKPSTPKSDANPVEG